MKQFRLVSWLVGLALLIGQAPAGFAMEAPTIQLTTPNGGEIWEVGSVQNIAWQNGGFTDIRLDYRVSDTAPWQLIVDGLDGQWVTNYDWTVPNTPTATAMVRIEGYFSGGGPNERYDESDSYFAIFSPAPSQTLTVVRPNGGEFWKLGSWQVVRWDSTGIDRKVWIKIELSRGTTQWQTIGFAPNLGMLVWHVTGPKTDLAKIRVSLVKDPNINDVSDGFFRISNK
jgi:hypothetical protein